MALPTFLVKSTPKLKFIRQIRKLIDGELHTVCESASCPNIGECFSHQTLTFMILGNVCTRQCTFCGVNKGTAQPVDPDEPERLVAAVKKLGLNYVVITSVTRDDLPDGGSAHFATTLNALRSTFHDLKIEILIPDFRDDQNALKLVLEAGPYVLNHNVETIPRLYYQVRPQADYHRSLNLLANSKKIATTVYTKSGFMVGLGENQKEVFEVIKDLKNSGCDVVTIGQYLPPSRNHLRAERYVTPEEFNLYQEFGENLGLKVHSGPFVRSSYRAEEIAK
ncbi:lipoyl synthase [Candidatus Saganbacteria bacterium]|nr:lipoyl synthase [Candidatus Saganbacteria bacterium]